MSLDKMPDEFLDNLEEDPKTGCWVWFKDPHPRSRVSSPVYGRRAAWKYAYERLHGTIPPGFGRYSTVPGCLGSQCVNPDHRLGTPQDQRNVRHQCPVCDVWHGENPPKPQPAEGSGARGGPFRVRIKPGHGVVNGQEVIATDLTPEQQDVEDMFTDND